MSFEWSNKVVFITGASSGIGRGLAIKLAGHGAAIGLLARRADTLSEIAEAIVANGGRALALPADVTDAKAVRQAADELRARFDRVDVLIANAGVGTTKEA